jgi:hypothetical protein
MPGWSANNVVNSRSAITSKVAGVTAVAVAVRGTFPSIASSPKKSPGPSVRTTLPFLLISIDPSTITKNSCAMSPSFARTLPAGTETSSARRPISSTSLVTQPANSGTFDSAVSF